MAAGKKTGGRKAGTPNKATASVKQALQEAFEQSGGVVALTKFAKECPDEFYKLWAKIMPVEVKQEITGANGKELEVTTKVVVVPAKQTAIVTTRPLEKAAE